MKRILLSSLFFVLLAACAPASPVPIPGGSITGMTLDKTEAGTMMFFDVPVAQDGDVIGVDFRGSVSQGALRAQFEEARGRAVWQYPAATPGPFAVNTALTMQQPGAYRMGVAWDGPVQAQFNLQWKPGAIQIPTLSPLAFLGGAGMILVALGFFIWGWRLRGGRYLLWGALAWVITVVFKFLWAIPVNQYVYGTLRAIPTVGLPLFDIYVGLLTGVFEVALLWLVLRRSPLGQAPWHKALAFGIAFGAIEALLIGLTQLASVATAFLSPASFPPTAMESLAQLNNPLFSLAPVWERFFTIWVHILSNVLLFFAVRRREARWFWLAFLYKSAIDAVASAAQLNGLNTLSALWFVEALIGIWGLVGWWGTRRIARRYPALPEK